MKKLLLSIVLMIIILSLNSCDFHDPFYHIDNQPPSPPTGIAVLNGDNVVDISWFHNYENDVAGYNVYYSYEYDGKYTMIGSTNDNYFVDYGANNGVTYYYAVTAYDYNNNESELSYDVVYSTPRPEGFNQAIFDFNRFPQNSGYSFSKYLVVPYNSDNSDVFFENYNGTYYLDVWDDTDIQDMGYTQSIYDIPYAPVNGWSESKDAIASVGHTYVIWTWNNHFAKIRVKSITNDRIVFDWAYQLVEGEAQLKPKAKTNIRQQLKRNMR
ncbi:MAG: hypothetical protein HXY50_16370 [Ignavibacteriaceae bacterium]|nr:hypothetical protein [Ignavibacteriaceae bacterium]